jgi:hypothetical protein
MSMTAALEGMVQRSGNALKVVRLESGKIPIAQKTIGLPDLCVPAVLFCDRQGKLLPVYQAAHWVDEKTRKVS